MLLWAGVQLSSARKIGTSGGISFYVHKKKKSECWLYGEVNGLLMMTGASQLVLGMSSGYAMDMLDTVGLS